MKKRLQAVLQRIWGFDQYLVIFSLVKIFTLRLEGRNKEGDFFHFLRLLAPDATVLDIGANVGIMSAHLAWHCKRGRVHAFEPVPSNARALRRVMRWLGITRRVACHELALGDSAGAVTMTMPLIQGVRMQGLTHVQDESIEGYAASAMTFTVPLARLDDLDWLRDQPVAAIKLDVENYEQFVLRGAEALIRRCQPLIYCELWDNENRQICLKIMQEHGYRVQVLDRGRLRTFLPGTDTHHNFFFVPEKKA